MFCSGCGTEIDEGENFCFKCGQDLSKYQQKFSTDEKTKEDVNPVEHEEIEPYHEINESDGDAKIHNLIDIVSKLQDENKELKKQLEEYNRQESPVSRSKTQFSKKRMPKPDKDEKKDDIFSKFKKWYNE